MYYTVTMIKNNETVTNHVTKYISSAVRRANYLIKKGYNNVAINTKGFDVRELNN